MTTASSSKHPETRTRCCSNSNDFQRNFRIFRIRIHSSDVSSWNTPRRTNTHAHGTTTRWAAWREVSRNEPLLSSTKARHVCTRRDDRNGPALSAAGAPAPVVPSTTAPTPVGPATRRERGHFVSTESLGKPERTADGGERRGRRGTSPVEIHAVARAGGYSSTCARTPRLAHSLTRSLAHSLTRAARVVRSPGGRRDDRQDHGGFAE